MDAAAGVTKMVMPVRGGSRKQPSGDSVVRKWYAPGARGRYHWYGRVPPDSVLDRFGSFIQVIWRQATRVGVSCQLKDGLFYVAAVYDEDIRPEDFPDNVKRPKRVRPYPGGDDDDDDNGGGDGGDGDNCSCCDGGFFSPDNRCCCGWC